MKRISCKENAEKLAEIREELTNGRPVEVHNQYETFYGHGFDGWLRKGKRVAICDQLEERMPLIKRPKPQMVELPSITAEQYALLCECIRYRIADNTRERMDAEERGLGLAYYDKMEMRLKQLKNIFPPID